MSDLNERYKKWHKPNMSDNAKFHQGYFYPKNKAKCLSKENIYRSSWEFLFMGWLDKNPSIKRWASEPIAVPYKNPVKNLEECKKNGLDPRNPALWVTSKYFTDFWYEIEQKDGSVKKVFVEIKPYAQTLKPQPISQNASLKEHRDYIRKANTYLVNMSKWSAALKYFKSKGCDFIIVTEKTLEKLGLL